MTLPLMAMAQSPDQQQGGAQSQSNEQQEPAAKKRKQHSMPETNKPAARRETGATMREGTKGEGHIMDVKKGQTKGESHSTKTETKVNKEEFKSSHTEVFKLGQHPKEFFIQRYGASHFRLIGNTYFVFVDGCWVAVDVAGFTFVERIICQGDPDYIVVY